MSHNVHIQAKMYGKAIKQAVHFYHAILSAKVGKKFVIVTPQRTVVVTVTDIQTVTP